MPQQKAGDPPQEQHVIASPNPSIDDSKSAGDVGLQKVEGTKVEATKATTQAPMKTTTGRKSKPRRARPRS